MIKLGVIFGGESVEHEVSIISAVQAMNKMDNTKYEIIPIYITKDKEYVFIYFLGKKDENAVKMIEELKQKYKIIDLNDIHNKYYKSNPNEFLYLLKNSKIVLTDSFHASVFSIIFEKPFVVFDRNSVTKKMNSRIETLLNELELKHHKYSSNMNESVIFDNKYDNANRILRSKRNECLSYVNKFLGDYND